jgi:hypothetical protein
MCLNLGCPSSIDAMTSFIFCSHFVVDRYSIGALSGRKVSDIASHLIEQECTVFNIPNHPKCGTRPQHFMNFLQ